MSAIEAQFVSDSCTHRHVCLCVSKQVVGMPVKMHACVHAGDENTFVCLYAANCRHAAMCPIYNTGY